MVSGMTLSLMVFLFFFLAGNNKARALEAVKKLKQETLNNKGTAYGELGPSLGRNRVPGELATPAWPSGWAGGGGRGGRDVSLRLLLSFGCFCFTTLYKIGMKLFFSKKRLFTE